jgi:uncharacterized glyoxalase superfamily protein PhnB
MPSATVIPVLHYPAALEAASWLCRCFGFAERLRIGTHRVQLEVGDGAVVVATETVPTSSALAAGHSVMVRVQDVDAHCDLAASHGARIVSHPQTQPYGERQYTAEDLAGHLWSFSQSVENVPPRSWGGELVEKSVA